MFFAFVGLSFSIKFALLYAGSNGWYNYRHQADIFTIYNLLLNRGFTASTIKLIAYDDIANDASNPFQGQIFHTTDHKTNVYPGSSAIDIKGDFCTAQSLYDSITNLPTTAGDKVFIYYDNHGGPGLLGVPSGCGDDILAPPLSQALTTAADSNLWGQCLFLIEACYAGSTAETFTAANLATITAANNAESSYAAVYDSAVGAYLSNEFINHFIALCDESPDIDVGTLYKSLKSKTTQSHVMYYGEESVKETDLSEFIGIPNRVMKSTAVDNSKKVTPREATEASLSFLAQKHTQPSVRAHARLTLLRLKTLTQKLDSVMDMLVRYLDAENYHEIMNNKTAPYTPAYYRVLKAFTAKFGQVNPDDLDRFFILKALTATHTEAEIIKAFDAVF